MQKNVSKILIIISIIIIVFGIIASHLVSNELVNEIPDESIMVDGSDFSGIAQVTGVFGAAIISMMMIVGSIFAVILIWIVYGMVCLMLLIIKKMQKKKVE